MVRASYQMLVDWDNSGEEVSNGDFETDLAGWTEDFAGPGAAGSSQQTTAENAIKLGSLGSMEIDLTGATGSNARVERRQTGITAAPGDVWYLEGYYKGDTFNDAQVVVILQWLDSGGSHIGQEVLSGLTDVSGNFVRFAIDAVTAPANTAEVWVRLRVSSTASGGTGKAWFDLVSANKQTGPAEDVSSDLADVDWDWGRDQGSQFFGKFVSLNAVATLNNYNDAYNSYAVSDIKPGRKVRFYATDDTGTEILWTGFLERVIPRPEVGGRKTAELHIVGPLTLLNNRKLEVEMASSIATGDAVGKLLDALSWPSADRFLDTGQTTMTRWFIDNTEFIGAAQEAEETELGYLHELRNGRIAFSDRHARLDTTHQTSQATFSDAGGATNPYSGIEQDDPLTALINVVEAEVQLYTVDSLAVLWTLAAVGASGDAIEPGATRTYWARYPNPGSNSQGMAVDAWTTPVASTDYNFNSQSDGGGSDVTGDIALVATEFANRMKLEFTNNGSVDAYPIAPFQARGTPVFADDPAPVRVEDSASITEFYPHEYPFQPRWIPTVAEAESRGNLIISTQKNPLPLPRISYVANRSSDLLDKALRLNLNDRVTLVANNDTGLGINQDFFFEWEHHHIDSHRTHTVEGMFSDAEVFSDFWVWGFSKWGQTTRWAY